MRVTVRLLVCCAFIAAFICIYLFATKEILKETQAATGAVENSVKTKADIAKGGDRVAATTNDNKDSHDGTTLGHFRSLVKPLISGEGHWCQKNFNYTPPPKQIGDFTSGKVYLVGDSLMRQLCVLGRPGLCCNNLVKCNTTKPSFGWDLSHGWDLEIDASKHGSNQSDWQHLRKFVGRGGNNPQVIQLGPNWGSPYGEDPSALLESFWSSTASSPSPNDILIAGLMGSHYRPRMVTKWDKFTENLVRKVVNRFPGRVVLVGVNSQHFAGTGTYIEATERKCAPPTTGEGGRGWVTMRDVIWTYNVNRYLTHNKTAIIDVFQDLFPLWMCHRSPSDCTHWKDGIYNVLTGMILEGLGQL